MTGRGRAYGTRNRSLRSIVLLLLSVLLSSMLSPREVVARADEERTLADWTRSALAADDPARLKAIAALSRYGEASVPTLVQLLDSNDVRVKIEALKAVATIGPAARAAVPAVISALKDESPRVRRRAVQSLSEIARDDSGAIAALLRALGDTDPQVWDNASASLRGLGDPAIPGLLHALRDPNPRIRLGAAATLASSRALGRAQLALTSRTVGELVQATGDPDPDVRAEVIRALGASAVEAETFTSTLQRIARSDADENVRRAATQAIEKLQNR